MKHLPTRLVAVITGLFALLLMTLASGLAAAPASAAPADQMAYVTNSEEESVTPIDVTTHTAETPIQVGSIPYGIAINSTGTFAYVADYGEDAVTPIDLKTGTPGAKISAGSAPTEVAFTPDGKTAFVVDNGANTVTPIEVATGTPGTPIGVGTEPWGISMSPDGKTAYVADSGSNTVTPIDVATKTAGSPISVPTTPRDIAFAADGKTAYVTGNLEGVVTPIDVATGAVGTSIPTGEGAWGVSIASAGDKGAVANPNAGTITPLEIGGGGATAGSPITVGAQDVALAVSPDGGTALVDSVAEGTVTPVDLETDTAETPIAVGKGAAYIAFAPAPPSDLMAYVAAGSAGVVPIDVTTDTAETPIPLGMGDPFGIAVNPEGTLAYATDRGDGEVTPIDLVTNTAEPSIKVGSSPTEVAFTPDGKTAFVTNSGEGTVTPIEVATGTPGTPISVGTEPWGVSVSPDGTTAYVANTGSNSVTPIDVATLQAGTPIAVGQGARDIAFTPNGKIAYVSDSNEGMVTPIDVETETAETPFATGATPWGLAVTPDGSTLLVAEEGTATAYEVGSGAKETPYSAGTYPTGLAISPDGSTALVANEGSGDVSVLDLASGTTGTPIHVGGAPGYVAFGGKSHLTQGPTGPEFDSAGTATFDAGESSSFQIKVSETATITESGELPEGVTFTDNGDGTATLSGAPAAGTDGEYKIEFTASDSEGEATQKFLLKVETLPLRFTTSTTTANFYTGVAGNFTFTTSGAPAPALSEPQGLPAGVTFTDNGNGTATLGGTPAAGTAGEYQVTVEAHNGVAPEVSQTFTLKIANGSEPIDVPDPNLRAALELQLGPDFTASQAAAVTVLRLPAGDGPVGDLTGLEAFPNIEILQFENAGNTFKSVAPLESLTHLRVMFLENDAHLGSLSPLVNATGLTTLTLRNDAISDPSSLPSLPKLGALNLSGNPIASLSALPSLPALGNLTLEGGHVSNLSALSKFPGLAVLDLGENEIASLASLPELPALQLLQLRGNELGELAGLPSLPDLTELELSENQLSDPAEIASVVGAETAPAKLTTLNLSGNLLTEVAPLVPLGAGSNLLGRAGGLNLSGNRIADFTPLAAWAVPPTGVNLHEQTIYAGAYDEAGGVTIPALKDVKGTTPTLVAGQPATYEAATNHLTLTGTQTNVKLADGTQASWEVIFSSSPQAEAGADPTAPTIGPAEAGGIVNKPGQKIAVTSPGTWMGSQPCTVAYQWLRDGKPIQAVPFAQDEEEGPDLHPGGVIGDGGTGRTYVVQPQDLGHRLSARVSCAGTTLESTSAPTPVVAGYTTPLIQALEGGTVFGSATSSQNPPEGGEWASELGDPTIRTMPIWVGQLGANGKLVNPATLSVAVTSNNPKVLPASDITVSGTGSERTVSFDPQSVGEALLHFTVTNANGETSGDRSLATEYFVTPHESSTSRQLYGLSNASTAIDVGGGYLMVGDDDLNQIFLYNTEKSELPEKQFPVLQLPPGAEAGSADIEASARKGNTLYWIGSQGNKDSGKAAASNVVFDSTLSGSGASATLAHKDDAYTGLREDLIKWDEANGNRFGFAAGAAIGMSPDAPTGFNIEGAEFSPDNSSLYLGFRAPLVPTVPGGKALIVPWTNVDEVLEGTAAHAQFGQPIELNLDGGQIREMRKNAAGEYLILASPSEPSERTARGETEHMWVWNGEPNSQPVELPTELPLDLSADGAREGQPQAAAWEGIGALPDHLTAGGQVRLLEDQGDDTGVKTNGNNGVFDQKEEPNLTVTKSRTDLVTLEAPAGTPIATSGAPQFPDQAEGTIGSPQTVTIINDGFTSLSELKIERVATEGADSNDFLLSGDSCQGETLAAGQSCTVDVRYAPSEGHATSTAQLVIKGNMSGGSTAVALSGTTSGPVVGEKGEKGDQGEPGTPGSPGQTGAPGQPGTPGQTGAQGEPGPQGADGAQGESGPQGAGGAQGTPGPQGPTGSTGPAGPQGPTGPRGPAGVSVKGAEGGQPTITVDSKGDLVVKVSNAAKNAERIQLHAIAIVGGKKVTIASRTVTVKPNHLAKVELSVDKHARAELGHETHPLEVTATPLGGQGDSLTTHALRTRVALAAPQS